MELRYMTVLWGIVSFSGLKTLFLHSFSHATSGSHRPNCSSHSCNCKTPTKPLILLVTPSFDWNTTEQYDDFQLFRKSVESWFTLQNIPAETPEDPTPEPNSTQLEYVLNFLGNTGHRKFDHLKPTGTADEIAKKKKCASAFMDYLSSTMDHAVSPMLQNLPTGRCSHLTWRVIRWTCWPSPSSCWSMQFPNRRWTGTEHPVQIRKSPKWQGTHQEAASPRSDSNNIKDAWSVPHTHCHLRQPWGHGIEGTENSQYGGKTNLATGENLQQTVCTHVDAAQSLTHLADHHAQQGMTTAEDVEN